MSVCVVWEDQHGWPEVDDMQDLLKEAEKSKDIFNINAGRYDSGL